VISRELDEVVEIRGDHTLFEVLWPQGIFEYRSELDGLAVARSILKEFVIPEAKRLPGFQKGMWLNDGAGIGICVVQFDTKEYAVAALDVLAPANGPEIIGSATCEVEIEAITPSGLRG
jgi:hypothetical protein